jgi:hypothetical protein
VEGVGVGVGGKNRRFGSCAFHGHLSPFDAFEETGGDFFLRLSPDRARPRRRIEAAGDMGSTLPGMSWPYADAMTKRRLARPLATRIKVSPYAHG